ncbi:Putative adenylate kinase [Candidatus Bilamarchaeum dharawalense]|uniref:Putative adenylate kinase n=1 Tax=Candidatus Bilamarchaeum dharawalense TaxID=2885759 RepID=A0A5E4LXS2_9ARCH|nr:Putative adenylate kinase [Candidatus Bilamarchaeum dharawalense]
MRIIITGTPGTGKSTISKSLAKELKLELVDIKKIVMAKKLSNKKHEVDIRKLVGAMRSLKNKKNYLVEGHLACEFFIPADFIIVLRTHPRVLQKRLKKRKYNKKKIQENIMTEMLDYCTQRVIQIYKKKPLELDTSRRSPSSSIEEIKKAIKQKKKKIDSVDYSSLLVEGY